MHALDVVFEVDAGNDVLITVHDMFGKTLPVLARQRIDQRIGVHFGDVEVLDVALEEFHGRGCGEHQRDVDDAPLVEETLSGAAVHMTAGKGELQHSTSDFCYYTDGEDSSLRKSKSRDLGHPDSWARVQTHAVKVPGLFSIPLV